VTPLASACLRDEGWLLAVLHELVACESPSTDRDALERCAALLAGRLAETGAKVGRVPAGTTADHVIGEWPGAGPRVLLLGHFDTVWPVGQLSRMPIVTRDGRMYGPGVLDMKAGLAIGLAAVRAVTTTGGGAPHPHLTLLATSDEETGSRTSRAAIEDLARRSDAVLVLEPALAGGAVKTSRKGVGEFEIVAHGVASHAGADPGAGASAIHELARQIAAIESLNDPRSGVSVNVGVVEGGTRSNVVAEHARAVVDVRVSHASDAAQVAQALQGLTPFDARVRLEISGGITRPPMERTAGVVRLYELARAVAAADGLILGEGTTGGASDGNFTAALGVPTIDGLGAIGAGPHALEEHVVVAELARRAALVAGLIDALAAGGR
jgi:glutamate carboxypeptidase